MKHTIPNNEYEQAVIARSKQLTDFKWTPIRDVPTYIRNIGNTVLEAGEEVVGFPYSSTELNDKFFTENVSFETFLSAIVNPYSKLYQPGTGALGACSYGIVCNGLVRYALGIERRVSTMRWLTIPGMRLVAPRNKYTVDDIKLCDVLFAVNEGINHVALITDIIRDDNDVIVAIEVSEAVRPSCKRATYNVETFYEKYTKFGLCRYDYIDKVPLLDENSHNLLIDNPYKCTPKIAVDNGNRSNYLEGEETLISVFAENDDTIIIEKDGVIIEEVPVGNKAMLFREFMRGYYVLRLKQAGDFVEFCVNRADLSHKVLNGKITVCANSNDENSEIVYMDFRVNGDEVASLEKYEELTDEEKRLGVFTRGIPSNGKNYKIYFKNKYGVWAHRMSKID